MNRESPNRPPERVLNGNGQTFSKYRNQVCGSEIMRHRSGDRSDLDCLRRRERLGLVWRRAAISHKLENQQNTERLRAPRWKFGANAECMEHRDTHESSHGMGCTSFLSTRCYRKIREHEMVTHWDARFPGYTRSVGHALPQRI